VDGEFGGADAFAGRFEKAPGTEGRLADKDGIAAARFGFDDFARGFAADFFVGGPQENEVLGNGEFQLLEGFEGKERLDDTGFHIEGAWAIDFAGGDAEGHAGEAAGGIDGVIVAEDEELAFGASSGGRPNDAEMIAAVILLEHVHNAAAQEPLIGEEATTAVGGRFFEAGRFEKRQFAQKIQHAREARIQ
jgi:hypothetical protein